MPQPALPERPMSPSTTGNRSQQGDLQSIDQHLQQLQLRQQPQSLPLSQSQSDQHEIISYDNLEYPVIPSDIATKHLAFEIELPQYINELSSNKLQALIRDTEVLKGMLLSRYETHYQSLVDDITDKLNQQILFSEDLISTYENKIIPEVDALNLKLVEHSKHLDQYNQLQVMMYNKLNLLSKKSFIESLKQKVAKSDRESQEIVDSILAIPGEIKESDLDTFIQAYKIQRQEYHIRKERLCRLMENRVGGM